MFFLSNLITYPIFSEPTNEYPPGYAVATANAMATNAALEILAQGGNAFDAAVAASAMLGVVEPYHSGLGGGSFWLLHSAKDHKNIFIDGRETAPLSATKDMFLDAKGQLIPNASLTGGLSAAIPGHPAALIYVNKHYGKLPLAKVLAPAIARAEKGFLVDRQYYRISHMTDRQKMLAKYPASAAIFLKNGQVYQIGDRLIQNDLANTLKTIALKGNDGFYKGEIAEKLVKGANAAGAQWSLKDLAQYRIIIREPLIGAFHNMLVITAPPPSAGGIALLTMLNILSAYPLDTFNKVQWTHYLLESMKLAYWQRNEFLGDPDFIKIPTERLISADNAKYLRGLISEHKALSSSSLLTNSPTPSSTHNNTSHLSIIDREGNRVAVTMTINYIFGSSVVPEGTGVLLNDEMDDFSAQIGQQNVFGIVGNEENAIAPGKRAVSTMTPTFLEMPNRIAILGTPGGSRIATMMLLASLIFHEGNGAISMVSGMRFHHQYMPDVVQFEPDTFNETTIKKLKSMGHTLMPLSQYYGDMQAITWDKNTKIITAASDPRGIGQSASITFKDKGYGVKY